MLTFIVSKHPAKLSIQGALVCFHEQAFMVCLPSRMDSARQPQFPVREESEAGCPSHSEHSLLSRLINPDKRRKKIYVCVCVTDETAYLEVAMVTGRQQTPVN